MTALPSGLSRRDNGILRVASKYFGRLNTASAHFTKEEITYHCSVNMQISGLPMRSAEAKDKDIYLTFDAALAKVAKQVRRTKQELREAKVRIIAARKADVQR